MDDRELPSDSDESDEDYVPSGAESNPPSEEESDGAEDGESGGSDGDDDGEKSVKRKKGPKSNKTKRIKKKHRRNKQAEIVEEAEEENIGNGEENKLTEEEQKKKADSLWSDFLKDTGTTSRSKLNEVNSSQENAKTTAVPAKESSEKENKVTITKVFEFAGEEVRVTKEVDADSAEARILTAKDAKPAPSVASPVSRGPPARSGGGLKGLSSVLGTLGKKPKLGTLEKSKLDWEKYKQVEGIQDELQIHNRGKDGYLEKQDFLQRTDLRQFEKEKAMRAAARRSNR